MKKYLGVKIIEAKPMCEGLFLIRNENCEWNGDRKREGYKVVYEDGYVSWSPKEVFEKAYRQINALTFGLAIEALKLGKKVCRFGWNGKGMWLELIRATEYQIDNHNLPLNTLAPDGNIQNLLPWIGMKTADNKFVPWLASQTDVLAEDWEIIE